MDKRENTKNRLNEFLPGLNEYKIARTAYFDKLFVDALKDKTPQIVLLGAGYDSRAYRFSKSNHGTRIFELDIPPTQDRKKKCLRKARIDIPNHVTFVPINFNLESIKDTLEKAGYSSDFTLPEELPIPANEQKDKAFFRHTEASEQTGNTVSFEQAVRVQRSPLWPCPGMGPIKPVFLEVDKEKKDG